jgi:hypothetical protein
MNRSSQPYHPRYYVSSIRGGRLGFTFQPLPSVWRRTQFLKKVLGKKQKMFVKFAVRAAGASMRATSRDFTEVNETYAAGNLA